ncbi:MAG: hypothetical protein KDH96_03745 [Candidatus Riesia sp.]|nr:hypothetical protein [Candidatus Riesia sp.]
MIFIPNKIKVGYQTRSDTYTGKLAYVIYYDNFGKLRKEQSWNSWRNNNIEPDEFENIPTEGFVLNKKVGDYSGSWGNHRQAYCRVYDPRGFEFEITINNLLFILENINSIVGKGLEGEFVYSWDGKDLVLLPTSAPDYKKIKERSTKLNSNVFVSAKDLIIGATYKDNNSKELIYMGRYDYYTYSPNYTWHISRGDAKFVNKGKYHWFKYVGGAFTQLKSTSKKIISCVDDQPIYNYAELFEKMEHNYNYSPIVDVKYIRYTEIDVESDRYVVYFRNGDTMYIIKDDDLYSLSSSWWRSYKDNYKYDSLNKLLLSNELYYREIWLENGKLHSTSKGENYD